jgi:pimeloyl-ACP methyl ester carboxylesterase
MKQLIILHGALGAQTQFEALKAYLTPDFEIAMFDFEGHGTRTSSRNFSIHHFVENTHAFLKELQWEKPLVFGYSMGGYVALKLESVFPGTFQQIITLGTKFHWNPESAKKEVNLLNPVLIEEKIPAFATYLKSLHGSENWKEVLQKTADMMLEMGEKPPLTEVDLNCVKIPVLSLRGGKDVMVTQEETAWAGVNLHRFEYREINHWQHPIDRIPMNELGQELKDRLNQKTNLQAR